MKIVLTHNNLTAEQIDEARDRWSEWISSERSATAKGLRESSTAGGLPIYPPLVEIYHARVYIAKIISALGGEEVDVDVDMTNHPEDPAEVRLGESLGEV